MSINIAELTDRSVVSVRGPEAAGFLQGLVTADVEALATGSAAYGALLSPQGKILFDFLAVRTADGFLLDVPLAMAADFAKRLRFYRLRAQVEIAECGQDFAVLALWGGVPPPMSGWVYVDPRLADLGHRAIVPSGEREAVLSAPGANRATAADWHAHRIALGVPEGGLDFAYGDAFPHDADMDDLAGVDFQKGCYVGQEVVSRMKHRGTARRRVILAETVNGGPLPGPGTDLVAGGKPIGSLGSSAGSRGLALARIDRVREALDAGLPILAADVPVSLALPAFARFSWPIDKGE